jgi:hypothetical protein
MKCTRQNLNTLTEAKAWKLILVVGVRVVRNPAALTFALFLITLVSGCGNAGGQQSESANQGTSAGGAVESFSNPLLGVWKTEPSFLSLQREYSTTASPREIEFLQDGTVIYGGQSGKFRVLGEERLEFTHAFGNLVYKYKVEDHRLTVWRQGSGPDVGFLTHLEGVWTRP